MAYATDYDVSSYGHMLAHRARVEAYVSAIRAAVRPGDVVMDLGTGTGFMALIACQCGARRVYAIEPTDSIRIAEQAARDNGFADRITFLHARSRQVNLPEKCDVLISDLRGATPCFSTHLTDLMDVRERLLQPDARWICQVDTLYVGVTEIARPEEQIFTQWDGARWGLDLRSALPVACEQTLRRRSEPHEMLSPSRPWAEVRYPTLSSPHVRGSTSLPITRAGAGHGLVIWLGIELYGGARVSNGPGEKPGIYSPVFLPWPRALELQPDDRAEIGIDAIASGHDYWWRWTTTVFRPGAPEPIATFTQTTLRGLTTNRAALAVSMPTFAPRLSAAGEETRFVLERMDGRTSQGDLAAALRARFPERFRHDESAIACVSEIRRAFGE